MRVLALAALLVFIAGVAEGGNWEHNNRIQPGENRNYLMLPGTTEASAILDGRRCGTISFAYERDIEGTNNTARASLYACPKADSVKADCLLAFDAFLVDTFEMVSTHRPGFWLVDDITAPASGAVARVAAYCGGELVGAGGGGSATRFCNISVESATLTDDIMCGKATTDLTLVRLTCNSTSAGTLNHQVRVFECTSTGANCTTGTGMNVTLNNIEQETEVPTSNDTIEEGNWFILDTFSLTTPAAWMHCQVEYTE
jgi:hypothetical protein